MNKEELKTKAQKFLELSDPIFVSKLAPKLKAHARLIYLVSLILLAISLLSSFVMFFTLPKVAFVSLLFVFIEFVILRMFCEFLATYEK